MRERVELIGGRFQVDAGPGRGTTIDATIPLAAPATGNEMP
jgi:signal transduction histidine kinase